MEFVYIWYGHQNIIRIRKGIFQKCDIKVVQLVASAINYIININFLTNKKTHVENSSIKIDTKFLQNMRYYKNHKLPLILIVKIQKLNIIPANPFKNFEL